MVLGVNASGQAFNEYPIPTAGSAPRGIAAGSDGNLWFTEFNASKIVRITTAGVVTEFPIPTAGSGPNVITTGPDGNLWFTEGQANNIGQITTGVAVVLVPTLSPAALALLAIALVGIGFLVMKRNL